jgi:ubiquinone/menaquinone biosynthesis C-methylase UbiE
VGAVAGALPFADGAFDATLTVFSVHHWPDQRAGLDELRRVAAHDGANLMPQLLTCARVHASEGEIIGALQAVWGTYTETPVY